MNLVLIPGSSEVMTKEINTQNAVYVYLCVWVSVTSVWSIAQGAVAVISINFVVVKVSAFYSLKSGVSIHF